MPYVVGIDIGGTFTDAFATDDTGRVASAKAPSTPPDYSRGVLDALDELAAWYRDLVAVAVGAGEAVLHYDRLAELRADGGRDRIGGAERAAEAVRETWRNFQEFNLDPELALEALFVELRREFALAAAPA